MDELKVDEISRIALIALKSGRAASLEEANAQIAGRSITILAPELDTAAGDCQAALVAALELGVRCFGTVTLASDTPDVELKAGPRRGMTLADAARAAGARVTSVGGAPISDASVVIGPGSAVGYAVRATWSGWIARARPVTLDEDNECSGGNVVAAIASAALAIGEAFHYLLEVPGSDAGYRLAEIDLWGPGEASETFSFGPAAWWLVGLGHLGQANAFVISHLPYSVPSDIELVLQDTDITSRANHGTSILTPRDALVPKTRLVARAMEDAGLRTRIIERRMTLDTRPGLEESGHIALIGVDNMDTRRLISSMGWSCAIDAGLGHRASNYQSISLHSFPGAARSENLPAWQESGYEADPMPISPGFADLARRFEQCGVVELAGKAAAVPFVGMLAAAIAVAAAAREVVGGGLMTSRRFDMNSLDQAFGRMSTERVWAISAHPLHGVEDRTPPLHRSTGTAVASNFIA